MRDAPTTQVGYSHPSRSTSNTAWGVQVKSRLTRFTAPVSPTRHDGSHGACTTVGPDAVVIGSGPNGLVAANLLCDAGWSVTVLEAQPRIGGAVASDQDVAGGFVHDTFSSFYPSVQPHRCCRP